MGLNFECMKVWYITKLPKAASVDRLKVILGPPGWATTLRLDVDVSNSVKAKVILYRVRR